MAGKSITADTIVKTFMGNGIFVFQYRIVTHSEQRIHIIRKEIPDQAVPGRQHHIFCPVIHGHKVIGNQIPCKRTVITEILVILLQELGGIVFT